MQQAGSCSHRTCGAFDPGWCRAHTCCAGSSFRVPTSDRPGVWSGKPSGCEHHAIGDGRSWGRTLWAHPCLWFAVPSILQGCRHVKVANQGPGSSKWPWSVPFWRCPRLEGGLGVGTRIGSVLAVSMTLRHRSSHRLSEFVLSSASDGGGFRSSVSSKGCWGEGWGGAGRGGGVGKAAAGAGVGGMLALLRPPAWRGPLRLFGVPSGSVPGSGTLGGVGLRGSMWSRGPGWSVVGRTCAGGSVSGGRWGCGAIAWSGGGAVRGNVTGAACSPGGVSPWRLVVSPVMTSVGV